MSPGEGTLYALIVACEVAFWVALFSGLAFRYLLHWEPSRTRPLEIWFRIPIGTVFFWFVFGPLWQLIFLGRKPRSAAPASP